MATTGTTLITFQPLDTATWPGPFTADNDRAPSRFSASWDSTLRLLRDEVAHASDRTGGVLEVPFPRSRIYRDGGGVHAAAAAPSTDAVAVSFTMPGVGPMRFAVDRYKGTGYGSWLPGWQANVRAIALGLEALRAVDRYGITRRAEQYRGWRALGTGDESATALGSGMTIMEAATLIAEHTDDPTGWLPDVQQDPSFALSLFRDAAKLHHPDQGGNPAVMASIITARDVLQAAFPGR